MEQVGKNLPSISSGKPRELTSEQNSVRANKVWSSLIEMYGTTLVTNYGATPPPMWTTGIAGLTDRQLGIGLRRMVERDTSFAPSLGVFVAACKRPSDVPVETSSDLTEGEAGMVRAYNIDPSGLRSWEAAAVIYAKKAIDRGDEDSPHVTQLSEKLRAKLADPIRPDF